MSDHTGAGWHPDPQQPGQLRYWDGSNWTNDTRPAGPPPGVPPYGGQQYGGQQYGGQQYGGTQPGVPPFGGQRAGGPVFAPPAPKEGKGCLYAAVGVVALLVLLGILGAVAGSGDDKEEGGGTTTTAAAAAAGPDEGAGLPDSSTTVGAEPPSDDSTPSGQEIFSVGETGHTGDLDVTVNEIRDPYSSTNEFEKPDAGERYLAVELTVTNTSDEAQIVSTLASMELVDSESRRWDVAFAGFDLPQIDGEVPAKETRRGWVVFGVPEAASGLTLRVKGNFTATGSVFALG